MRDTYCKLLSCERTLREDDEGFQEPELGGEENAKQ